MTSIATSGRNVLAEPDKRVPTSFYWSLTLLATLGGFLFGYDTANIGSALPFVPYSLSGFALGYLVAGASLGAAAGALLAGPPPVLDAGSQAGADRGLRVLHLPADHRHQRAAVLRAEAAWPAVPGRQLQGRLHHSIEEVVQIFEREAEGGQGASGPPARDATAA